MLDFSKNGGVFKSELKLSGSDGRCVTLHLDERGTSLLRSRLCRSFFKTTSPESLLEKVRGAKSVAELEKIAKKYYLCDLCRLSGVNLYGAKKIFEVVIEVLYRYPMLRSRLAYIGSRLGYEEAINSLCHGESEALAGFGMQYLCSPDTAEELGHLTRGELDRYSAPEGSVAMALAVFGLFDAIIINDERFYGYNYIQTANDVRYSERVGYHPKGCDGVESVVYHEIGHMLDYMCRVTDSDEFSSFYNSIGEERIREELSEYALSSSAEFFAEAVAEHFCSKNPGEISGKCLSILDKLYEKISKI